MYMVDSELNMDLLSMAPLDLEILLYHDPLQSLEHEVSFVRWKYYHQTRACNELATIAHPLPNQKKGDKLRAYAPTIINGLW